MGQHADDILNGDVDEFTGEWLGNGKGFPRRKGDHYILHKDGRTTNINHDPLNYSKGTKAIRKELAILIEDTIKEHPEKNENALVNDCRQIINTKYGKGWREQF